MDLASAHENPMADGIAFVGNRWVGERPHCHTRNQNQRGQSWSSRAILSGGVAQAPMITTSIPSKDSIPSDRANSAHFGVHNLSTSCHWGPGL